MTYKQRGKTSVKAGQSRFVTKVMRVFLANRSASLGRQLKKIEYHSFDCPTSFLLFPLFSPPPPHSTPLPTPTGEEKPGNEVAGCRVKTKRNQHS